MRNHALPVDHVASLRLPKVRSARRRGGFTLIEMMVVISIIVILMVAIVAVGSSLRQSASRRKTLLELKMLDGLMKDYLAAGNPEPPVFNPSMYTTGDATVNNSPGYAPTVNPASDPVNWVIALRSSPVFSKKLDDLGLSIGTDQGIPKANPAVINTVILDAYGTPIRYVRSDATNSKGVANTSGAGYFMSAGPDGKFSMAVDPTTGKPIASTSAVRADEIYSYDPQ